MKKTLSFFLIITMLCCINPVSLAADVEITGSDGPALTFETVSPYLDQNGRTMFPLVHFNKIFGPEVQYQVDGDHITMTRKVLTLKTVVTLTLNSNLLYKDGKPVQMDTVPVLKDGYFFVPLRFVGNALDYWIWWNSRLQQVNFDTNLAELYIWNENKSASSPSIRYALLPGIIRQRDFSEMQTGSTANFDEIKAKIKTLPRGVILSTFLYHITGYKLPYQTYQDVEHALFDELNRGFCYTSRCLDEIPPIIKSFDSYSNSWYSEQLFALGESTLYDSKKHIYRFTCIRTFDEPFSIRIEVDATGTGTLRFAMCDSSINPCGGDLSQTKEISLTKAEVTDLLKLLEKTNYWSQPETIEVYGCDGSEWIVEGVKDGNYHAVDRWSPDEGAVYELGKRFIKLSKQQIEDLY